MKRDYIMDVLKEYNVSEKKMTDGISAIDKVFGSGCEIQNFRGLKQGMTNRIFIFTANGRQYLLRVPGEGTEELVDRYHEVNVYQTLSDRNITEKYVYLGAEDGIKIEEYITGCHACNVDNADEVRACMRHLRSLHDMRLISGNVFDVFEMINTYESACKHDPSEYLPDYHNVRGNMDVIRGIINSMPKDNVLCHIDPVPDNFLITDERIYLIDWEYASMSDPHIDIAMFCIYAGYDKKSTDRVIDMYFPEGCTAIIRKKIYGYVAACGFLWSLWCEIKRDSGIIFSEYEGLQYSYAQEFWAAERQ